MERELLSLWKYSHDSTLNENFFHFFNKAREGDKVLGEKKFGTEKKSEVGSDSFSSVVKNI